MNNYNHGCMYVGVFYDKSLPQPVVVPISDPVKFHESCKSLPTDWAYLFYLPTGKIIQTWNV